LNETTVTEDIDTFSCSQDCVLDTNKIQTTSAVSARADPTHGVLQTQDWLLHFIQKVINNGQHGPRFPINLAALSKYYNDEQFNHLDAETELKTVPQIDMPAIKIKFYKQDSMSNVKLDTILNATDWPRQGILPGLLPRPAVL